MPTLTLAGAVFILSVCLLLIMCAHAVQTPPQPAMALPAGVAWKRCFYDQYDRDLPQLVSDDAGISMTVGLCVQKCRSASPEFKYAGIQSGYQVILCCTEWHYCW
jgi:hypothetical protein